MKGYEMLLTEFMDGRKKRFIIPVYQRNYDWKTENCKQLFDDLVRIVREQRRSHFFGAIVFTQQMNDYVIIDGQQRLTTVSLLLLAMCHLLKVGDIQSASDDLAEEILEDYLIDKRAEDETRIKLKPIKDDQLAFQRLFLQDDEQLTQSNLSINYRFFVEQLSRNLVTPDDLYAAIHKLQIIAILLGTDDNPQLIFESLNSTGLDLSEGDKIRNYILMGLDSVKQEKYYYNYWNRIEKYTDYDVSSFIRDYLSLKLQSTPTLRTVYFTFKDHVSSQYSNRDMESLLIDLKDYARRYALLLHGGTGIAPLDACILRLNQLESTVTRPYLLEILNAHEKGNLSDAEMISVFETVESYLFRRLICNAPTNTLNKTFLLLHREVLRLEGSSENYVARLRYVLSIKRDKQRFPDDQEFADSLITRNIYDMQPKNKKYLFERLENYGTAEMKDVWERIESGIYTIEHIMPQHLTPAWIAMLGENHEEIHRLWLHRLANLTLTAYNSSYSNRPFIEKRDVDNGFRDSGIRMNQAISQKSAWGLSELEQRSNELAVRSLKIWPLEPSDFVPSMKPQDIASLDDDTSLTGKLITKFSFRGVEQPVVSWIDMYMQVLGILHHENRAVLARLAMERDDSVELSSIVTNKPEDSRPYSLLSDGIYVMTRTSTQYKIALLRRFFALFEVDPSDLVFYMSEDERLEDDDSRNDLRYKYWSRALPEIQKGFRCIGATCYSNTNPTRMNWLPGYLGYSGINISCIGNLDMLQVELYIGTPDAGKNKGIFDYLQSRKESIEQIALQGLIWDRGDDKKTSKIYVTNDQFGVQNDSNWTQAIAWHVEKSTFLYKAIKPMLTEYYGF